MTNSSDIFGKTKNKMEFVQNSLFVHFDQITKEKWITLCDSITILYTF